MATANCKGEPWDFDEPRKKREARELVDTLKPHTLTGSPECRAFSMLMNLNREKMGEEMYQDLLARAIKHVEFCCELYELQVSAGRFFVHEQPLTASSWKLLCILRVLALPGVHTCVLDMCAHGMWQVDKEGPGHVKKATRIMTNSPEVSGQVAIRCPGNHRHIVLIDRRAKAAQVYPEQLCRAILRGARMPQKKDNYQRKPLTEEQRRVLKQSIQDRCREVKLASLTDQEVCEVNSLTHEEGEDLSSTSQHGFWGDTKGGWLSPDGVRQPRQDELDYIRRHRVYARVPRARCLQATGKPPIKTG